MKDSYFLLKDAYGSEEMRKVWEETNMVQKWLDVEAAIANAQGKLGLIPKHIAGEIVEKCSVKHLTPQMIAVVKTDVRHLIVSTIKAFAKMCGPAGEYFHLGPTTQDILDTGLTLQIREAYDVIMRDLLALEEVLIKKAEKYDKTVMMGRTHGQQAVPITFGFKLAIWAGEIRDHIERFKELKKRLFLARISAATGVESTFVYLMGLEKTAEFEKLVSGQLGLGLPPMDLHQRTDRFAELLNDLALLCSSLGGIGLEIRDLQSTEVAEVEEPWVTGKYYSSSTMPNKRNPEPSEWEEGLAKIARANSLAMMDLQMQHERDATRMAVEFACIPESFLVTHAAIRTAIKNFSGLVVHADKMKENLYITRGIAMSEPVMLKLAQKTGKKVTAHLILYEASMKAFEEKTSLKVELLKHPEARKYLTERDIDEATNPETYIGTAAEQVKAMAAYINEKRKKD